MGNEAIRIHQLIFLYCVETFKFYNTDNQNVSWKLFFKDWIYFKLSSFHVTMDTFLPIEIKKWYISYNFHEAKHIINNLSDIFLLVCSSLQWYWSVTIKSNKYHKSQQHYDIQFFFFFATFGMALLSYLLKIFHWLTCQLKWFLPFKVESLVFGVKTLEYYGAVGKCLSR